MKRLTERAYRRDVLSLMRQSQRLADHPIIGDHFIHLMETMVEEVPVLDSLDFLTTQELDQLERRHTAARDTESSKPHTP